MDSDFDQRNAVLKRYFLWQASYHWHSGAFHILSMFLLLMHPPAASATDGSDESGEEPTPAEATASTATQSQQHWRFWALKSNTFAYIRSLFQHFCALGLIATAYVFSSLRRLTAIGMFAFDVSSWFLHLLQVCINAPDSDVDTDDDSFLFSCYKRAMRILRRPRTIACIHRYLVLPIFCYARLFIWPALWYSCMTESSYWLQQLERTLWTGSAQQLRWMFTVWLVLLLGMTAVYLRRLIYHPHVKRILRVLKQEEEGRVPM